MTATNSNTRLILYVIAAMVAAAVAGLETVDFANMKEVVQFGLSVLGPGVITARAYIDRSPAEITPKSDQP